MSRIAEIPQSLRSFGKTVKAGIDECCLSKRAAFVACRLFIISFIIALFSLASASAQTTTTVENRFVRATVEVGSATGRFWISATPEFGGYRFLYGNPFFITSNLVFVVNNAEGDHFFSNIPLDYPYRPQVNGEEIPFVPYNDFYRSDDTLALTWSGMEGYSVTVRFIPEKQVTEFDHGGDMLIEFSYTFDPLAPSATLGIFMMLDTYNSQAGGVNGESAILTSDRYFNIDAVGAFYPRLNDSIPEFYQVGNFSFDEAEGMILPIHRMKGLSHGGAPLVPPHTFAIGDWEVLRDVGFNLEASAITTTPLSDVATVVRWQGLEGDGTIRTAFGLNDREGNNLFHCHQGSLFFNVRSARVVEQKSVAGAYEPAAFDVDMWLANLDVSDSAHVSIRLDSIAAADGLALDPSTPAEQSVSLAARETKRLRWRLFMTPGKQIARADVPLIFSFKEKEGEWGSFRELCAPTITVKGFRAINEDSLPPVITSTGSGTVPRQHWNYRTFDRHAGYPDDSGIDTVRLVATRSRNVAIAPAAPINRCNVAADADLVATVIDTLEPAKLVFAVYDCKGNVAYDSASYTPPGTDTLPPVIERVDSSKGRWTFRLFDRHPGYIYDSGIETIRVELDRTENFIITTSSYAACDTSVTVNLAAIVSDSSNPGFIVFRVVDCRGNITRDSARYIPAVTGVEEEPVVAGMHPAIVEIRPQPLVTSSTRALTVTLRGLGRGAMRGELITADGRVAARFELHGIDDDGSALVTVPDDLPAGVYMLRVIGARGEATARVVVID